MKTAKHSISLLTASLVATATVHAGSYILTSTNKSEIVGTTAAVTGSGSSANFTSGTVTVGSTFASFQLEDGSGTRNADLIVTLTGVKGTLGTTGGGSGADGSDLMIAQTVNSQGLTDTGTLSVLTGMVASDGGESSVTLRFDFFEVGTSNPLAVNLLNTSFDYDYNQFLEVNTADYTTSAYGAFLTKTTPGSVMRFSDDGGTNSTFTDEENAVSLQSTAVSSYEMTMGKQGNTGNALFMFEFRDPSLYINLIPEPSSTLLIGIGALGCLVRRRR